MTDQVRKDERSRARDGMPDTEEATGAGRLQSRRLEESVQELGLEIEPDRVAGRKRRGIQTGEEAEKAGAGTHLGLVRSGTSSGLLPKTAYSQGSTHSEVLALFLGDELDAAALPLPPRVPAFACETVRPPRAA